MNPKIKGAAVLIALLIAAFFIYYTRPTQKIKRMINRSAGYIEKNQTLRLSLYFSDNFKPYLSYDAESILMGLKSSADFWDEVKININDIGVYFENEEAVAEVHGSLVLSREELSGSEEKFEIVVRFAKEERNYKIIEIEKLEIKNQEERL